MDLERIAISWAAWNGHVDVVRDLCLQTVHVIEL